MIVNPTLSFDARKSYGNSPIKKKVQYDFWMMFGPRTYFCVHSNQAMFKSPLSTLRFIGNIEGISYLLLLGLAMPLKYMAGMPMAVKIMGSIHGALFVAFMYALFRVWIAEKWNLGKVTMAFLLSLVPFGTFYLDRKIREEEVIKMSDR